jgi:type II secretory pathway pseudopilin PulG
LSTVVYALVGISAVALVPTLLGWIGADERAA